MFQGDDLLQGQPHERGISGENPKAVSNRLLEFVRLLPLS